MAFRMHCLDYVGMFRRDALGPLVHVKVVYQLKDILSRGFPEVSISVEPEELSPLVT